MKIVSRAEAMENGLKRYFTGRSCKNGHISERGVRSKACLECRRESGRTEKYRSMRFNAYWKNPEHKRRVRKSQYQRDPLPFKKRIERYKNKDPESYRKMKLKFYYQGPKNPTGEIQWLQKNKAQLRSLRRELKNRKLPDYEAQP